MADDSNNEKTEEPTPQRLRRLREEGKIAKSRDLLSSAVTFATAAALLLFSNSWAGKLAFDLHRSLSRAGELSLGNNDVMAIAKTAALDCVEILLPLFGFFLLISIGLNLGQVGFLFTPSALSPDINRINPVSGFKKLFSIRSVVTLLIGLGKLGLVLLIAVLFTQSLLPEFVGLIHSDWGSFRDPESATRLRETDVPKGLWSVIRHATIGLAFALSLVLLLLGLIDLWFQKARFRRENRMSLKEIRDEMKEQEGDPHVRARRKEVARMMMESRVGQAVQGADVVLTNPTHYSVALKYDPEVMGAPFVVAKGVDQLAMKIRRVAVEHGVPIVERPDVARALYKQVRVGHPIPVEMYAVLAEIMRYVYTLTSKPIPGMPREENPG